jgi:predicted ABC-type ATPase
MARKEKPMLVLIGGINGAGKTTLYYNQVKPWLESQGIKIPFVNADELEKANHANEIGKHSLEMGKLAAKIRDQYLETGQSFVTETVFSHESKNKLISDAQKAGFKVMLNHVHVDSPDLAFMRVQTRITQGGHAVPKDKVFSRYERTVTNIQLASKTADRTYVWDNSCSQAIKAQKHRFVMTMAKGVVTKLSPNLPEWAKEVYKNQIRAFHRKKGLDNSTSVHQTRGIYRAGMHAQKNESTNTNNKKRGIHRPKPDNERGGR